MASSIKTMLTMVAIIICGCSVSGISATSDSPCVYTLESDGSYIWSPNGQSPPKINDDAFFECEELTKITIEKEVTEIGERAFSYATGLSEVVFESGSLLKTVNAGAFKGCSSLTNIEIPAKVKIIMSETFLGASALKSVNFLGNKVAIIDEKAFKECDSLTSIKIPASVDEIGTEAFERAFALESVEIDSNSKLKEIGVDAFRECTSLDKINLPATASIRDNAFADGKCEENIFIAGAVITACYSETPSLKPSFTPSRASSDIPTQTPSLQPSSKPSQLPSLAPSDIPSQKPSLQPSSKPSLAGSESPSLAPSDIHSQEPSLQLSSKPSLAPSDIPSQHPSCGSVEVQEARVTELAKLYEIACKKAEAAAKEALVATKLVVEAAMCVC